VSKRGVSPSFMANPPLLDKERGTKGVRLPYIPIEGEKGTVSKQSL